MRTAVTLSCRHAIGWERGSCRLTADTTKNNGVWLYYSSIVIRDTWRDLFDEGAEDKGDQRASEIGWSSKGRGAFHG